MNITIKRCAGVMIAAFLMVAVFSCGKYEAFAEADYPESVIYMPTAAAIYDVAVANNPYEVPTPGKPYRFTVDDQTGNVLIPLAVLRGGISTNGNITVKITSMPDTVVSLIAAGGLAADLLPASAYTVPSEVVLPDGETYVSFNLSLNLAYLHDQPGKTVAVAVGISSSDRKANPDLATTIVVFNTDLLNDE